MSGSNPIAPPGEPAARRPFRRSPNRQRLVARAAVWTLAVGGAAFWIPHIMF